MNKPKSDLESHNSSGSIADADVQPSNRSYAEIWAEAQALPLVDQEPPDDFEPGVVDHGGPGERPDPRDNQRHPLPEEPPDLRYMPNRPPLPTDEEVITEMGMEASDAGKDSLTGLASRKGLDRALDRRFGVSLVAPTQYSPDRRRGGRNPKVAVILGDGGNMKEVNDAKHLGHLVGDRMLGVTGETIKKNFRPGDIMARLGGDE